MILPHSDLPPSECIVHKLMTVAFACTLVLVSSAAAAAVNRSSLEQRYVSLKTQYDSLKGSSADMRQLTPLISKIQNAIRANQLDYLNELFDQFEEKLQSIARASASSIVRNAKPTDGGSCLMSDTIGVANGGSQSAIERGTEPTIVAEIGNTPSYLTLIIARAPKVATDGAVGRNIGGFKDAAAQRDTIWLILRGLVTNSADDIEATLRALEYAFLYQAPAGNFENNHGVSATRAVEADAFFLQAFGRIYLLLANSQFRDCALPRLDALKPKLALSMHWLASQQSELERQDRGATNRLFFDALAFELNGKILNNPVLRQIGRNFAQAGLAAQRADGTFDEHGGSDTSYQAVSILNIAGLLAYEDDPEWRARLKASISQAVAWERTKTRPNGEIDVQGNSRTGLGQEEFMGQKKKVNYPEVALAFLYASAICNDLTLRTQGESIINYIRRQLHF